MNFVSKYSNYLLILRSSRPAVPAIGQPSVPGYSVRFSGDGLAIVNDEKIIKMILASEAFRRKDVVTVESGDDDPYKETREQLEPEHNILEMQYGAVSGNVNPKSKISFSKEQKVEIKKMMEKTVPKMAKEMAKEILKEMLKKQKKSDNSGKDEEKNEQENKEDKLE